MPRSIKFSVLLLIFILVLQKCKTILVEPKPNVIIMLMDDMGWGDLGANGDPAQETPNLDRMAREGMLFSDFYTANPLCSPSRAAFLTGRLPFRNGFYTDIIHARNAHTPQEIVGGISDWEILLPEILGKHGYRNKIVGKWHLGHQQQYLPLKHGFHEYFGSPNCHIPSENKSRPNIAFFRNDKMIGRYFENIKFHKQTSNLTQIYTEEAIDFITTQSQPFFLYWTPDSLHRPTYRSEEFVGRSRKGSSYGDALIEIDDSVGRILDTIRKNESLANNTFVFFTSDNGPALISTTQSDAGISGPFLCGKQTTFEGGLREPGIGWWPTKIKANSVNRQPATIMDLFSTVVSMAGIPMPSDRTYDSHDLSPVLFENKTVETNIYYYRGNQLMAIRSGEYKAHFWTFTTPLEEFKTGVDYCPGSQVKGITTNELTNHTLSPKLFQVIRDPGERYPISEKTNEYMNKIIEFEQLFRNHTSSLVAAKPVLNWCDDAVMHWKPPGCKEINMCLPAPQSKPYKCVWPH